MISKVQISKPNLLHNFKLFRTFINPRTKILSVVKANAYGHGLKQVVSVLDSKTDYFGVDDTAELRTLRKLSKKPTLVMGYVSKEELEEAVMLNSTLVIYDIERVLMLSKIAGKLNKTPKIHIKIDASLGRQGILISELEDFVGKLKKIKDVKVEGVYAHFANIEDTKDFTHAKKQIDEYKKALTIFKSSGFGNLQTHISSTAASLVYEKGRGINSIVRIGIGLYGLWPSKETKEVFDRADTSTKDGPVSGWELRPVMRWITRVAQVKTVPANFTIGYGLTYKTRKPTKIAIIPQGYSDGYDRGLSNCGDVLIHGYRCKVLGRVAMNMFAVDVSNTGDVSTEDEVVLLGEQKNERISAEEIAEKIGTINYEVAARISPLIPRVLV